MKRTFALIGLGMLLLPITIHALPAAPPLYGTVGAIVEGEQMPDDVANFVAQVIGKINPKPYYLADVPLSADDVTQIVKKGLDISLCGRLKLSWYQCPLLVSAVRTIAQREAEVWRLGHRLQIIATSNEEPITDFSLQPDKLVATYAEILDIWGLPQDTETGLIQSIRILPTPDDMSDSYQPLADALDNLDKPEKKTAAVWRYQYGLAFVKRSLDSGGSDSTDPDGQSGDKTERQYLFARPGEVESALDKLKSELDGKKPKLNPGDTVLYLIPVESNIIAWAYFRDTTFDKKDAHNLPESDVGLQWQVAVEPVRPSITASNGNDPILGGKYPPMPERKNAQSSSSSSNDSDVVQKGGGGLCESLGGSQGYLCRERETLSQSNGCLEGPPDPKTDTIILSQCPPEKAPPSMYYCCDNGCASPLAKCEKEGPHDTQTDCFQDFACYQYDTASTLCEEQKPSDAQQNKNTVPCAPDSSTAYKYTILGHACFIRDCAQRTYGHSIVPGRDPLVSEETASPWLQCMAPPNPSPTISLPPQISMPLFPPYNPHSRTLELDADYCQTGGKPPLMLPVVCPPAPEKTFALLSTLRTVVSFVFVQNTDSSASDTQLLNMEGRGLEAASTLYNDYLRKASDTLNGSLQGTVTMLQQLANSTFPMTMCPLNPQDDAAVCTNGTATK